MTKLATKAQERAAIDRFLDESKVADPGTKAQDGPNPPDFVLSVGGKSIGIELVRVFTDGPGKSALKQGQSLKRRVCESITKALEAQGVRPLLVSVGFTHDVPKMSPEDLAAMITQLVLTRQPRGDDLVDLDWNQAFDAGEWGNSWPEDLNNVLMLRQPTSEKHEVIFGDAGWELSSCTDLLQAAIAKKEERRLSYRDGYTETWLLLVAEGDSSASFISPDQATQIHEFKSSFDRTYFFRASFPVWFRLKSAQVHAP